MGYAERNGRFPDGKVKWRARWQLPERRPNGRHKEDQKDGFPSEKLARNFAGDQEAAIRAGTYISPSAGELSLDAYFETYLPAQDVSRGTTITYRQVYRSIISPVWGATQLDEFRTLPLLTWLKELRKRYARKKINIVKTILTGMFNMAAYEDRIRRSPLPPPSKKTRVRPNEFLPERKGEVFTRDEIAALLGNLCTWDMVVFVILGLFTGMRWSELAGCTTDRFRLEIPATADGRIAGTYTMDSHAAVHFDEKGAPYTDAPKSGIDRIIDLPPFLVLLIADYLLLLPAGQRLLFANRVGKLRHYNAFNAYIWRPACDGRPASVSPKGRSVRAAIPPACKGKNPHDMKHTNSAMMDEVGVRPTMQNYRLGHKERGSAGPYKHPTEKMREECVAALEEVWHGWAIDLTALPAWEARTAAKRGRALAPGRVTAVVIATPAQLQGGQGTLF